MPARLGKNTNCQTLVSLTLARDEVPIPIVLRLFCRRPGFKIRNAATRRGAEALWTERTKPDIALAELRRAMQAG
jgi:SRSO17 transposase